MNKLFLPIWKWVMLISNIWVFDYIKSFMPIMYKKEEKNLSYQMFLVCWLSNIVMSEKLIKSLTKRKVGVR